MKKEFKNLTVDNLIKTKWFNRFNKKQQEQIMLGLKNKIDVSIYAKSELSVEEMEEIRKRLEKEAREKLENEQNT